MYIDLRLESYIDLRLEVILAYLVTLTFGMYYGACKILIADVKCIMRPSFLPSLVSLGDQGDPTEQLLGILGAP